MSINKGMYSGNLTKKPEFTENGTCFFTIASQRHFKNKDGNYEADFINLKAFNFNAEKLVANCDKGDDSIAHFFNCKIIGDDIPNLGGEEAERNNPDNYYEIRKVNINQLNKIDIISKDIILKAHMLFNNK